MTSALILVFVNVFSFKISSTHVVFSALASNAVLFLPGDFVNYYWLGFEFFIWFVTPIFSVMISSFLSYLIENKLLKNPGSIDRMIAFIPFQIALTSAFMTAILVIKYMSDDISKQVT